MTKLHHYFWPLFCPWYHRKQSIRTQSDGTRHVFCDYCGVILKQVPPSEGESYT